MSDWETFWICIAMVLLGSKFASCYFAYKKEEARAKYHYEPKEVVEDDEEANN